MFCRNCGKELPDESSFCPYCMTKFIEEKEIKPDLPKNKKPNKKLLIAIIAVICVIAIVVVAIAVPKLRGSKDDSSPEESKGVLGNIINGGKSSNVSKPKSVDKDDNLGLMNVKIHDEGANLTDAQKLLVQYFDTDYFRAPYNSLQRYPQAFKGAQIKFLCYVTKIIESNDKEYTALVEYEAHKFYEGEYVPTDLYVVIKGIQTQTRLMEGDSLFLFGKYVDVDQYTVDGKSYTVPTVLVNRYTYFYDYEYVAPMYSMEDIRTIAKYIFGDDVKIRYTKNDDALDNIDEDGSIIYDYESYEGMYYTAELDNQSNANFTKYSFFAGWGGYIVDCKIGRKIKRNLTFSADFEHFYLQIFDESLNTYTLECYDRDLKKTWSREFDQTTNAVIDYTADHIYLVANGSMYIINAQTGEDDIEPKYVGAKCDIRKLKDGILLLAPGLSDAVMKTDLVGNVLWTANLSEPLSDDEIDYSAVVQIIGGNYVIEYTTIVVITPDGKIAFNGEDF